MRLLNGALLKRFAEVGRQEGKNDPLVIAKFFNPLGAGTWWATEFYPDERIFFGYVSIFGDWNDEWGYFSLDDLINIEAERALFWEELPASKVIPGFTGFSK